jgi:hypothetical protein
MGTVDLHELRVYQLAMRVGEDVWSITVGWEWLARQTIGLQWIRSADSIAANISEGYGRYSFKENAKFCYYARNRQLLNPGAADDLALRLEALRRQLDNYIHSLGRSSANVVREDSPDAITELPPLEDFLASFDAPTAHS